MLKKIMKVFLWLVFLPFMVLYTGIKKKNKILIGIGAVLSVLFIVVGLTTEPDQIDVSTQNSNVEVEREIEENQFDLLRREGHPIYWGDADEAKELWDDISNKVIIGPESYHDYSDQTILTYRAYDDNKIRNMQFYFKNMMDYTVSIEDAFLIAEEYMPLEIMKQYYVFDESYISDKQDKKQYIIRYHLNDEGKEAYDNGLSLTGILGVTINENKDGNADSLIINFPNDRHVSPYDESSREWHYDFLGSEKELATDEEFEVLVEESNTSEVETVNEVSFEGYRLKEIDGGNLSGHREPNVVVDIGFGDREYYAFTNEHGQLVKVVANEIILQDDANEPVLSTGRYYRDEAKVPGVESKTLDEGHVIADSLGGVSNAYNITPQNSTLNRHGDQAYMEKNIRDAGGCTDFTAIISYSDTETRIPNRYKFTYTLRGNVIVDEFENVNPDEVNAKLDEKVVNQNATTNNDENTKTGIEIVSVGLKSEEVVIRNNSDVNIDLQGYKLVSVTGNQSYTFPSYNLGPGESMTVYSGKGNGDLKWTGKYIWNNDGDSAELYTSTDVLADSY